MTAPRLPLAPMDPDRAAYERERSLHDEYQRDRALHEGRTPRTAGPPRRLGELMQAYRDALADGMPKDEADSLLREKMQRLARPAENDSARAPQGRATPPNPFADLIPTRQRTPANTVGDDTNALAGVSPEDTQRLWREYQAEQRDPLRPVSGRVTPSESTVTPATAPRTVTGIANTWADAPRAFAQGASFGTADEAEAALRGRSRRARTLRSVTRCAGPIARSRRRTPCRHSRLTRPADSRPVVWVPRPLAPAPILRGMRPPRGACSAPRAPERSPAVSDRPALRRAISRTAQKLGPRGRCWAVPSGGGCGRW